jgi:hypothetical protein
MAAGGRGSGAVVLYAMGWDTTPVDTSATALKPEGQYPTKPGRMVPTTFAGGRAAHAANWVYV